MRATAVCLLLCFTLPARGQPPRFEVLPIAPGTRPGADVARPLFEDRTTERITVAEKMTYGVAVGDVDGDGDLDIFHANFGIARNFEPHKNELWLNRFIPDGLATFERATLPATPPAASRKAAIDDLDGDGDLDIVVANTTIDVRGEGENQLLINFGEAKYKDLSSLLPASARGGLTCAVDLVDVDGDGDLDIFFGNYGPRFLGEANRLIRNDGNRRFTDVSHRLPDERSATVDAAFGDLDGDGDLDMVTAEMGSEEPDRVYLNDGTGRFTVGAALPIPNAASHSVRLARFNRDAHLDLLVGNLDGADRLLFGDGGGRFTVAPAGTLPSTTGPTTAHALADVNGDGVVDLVWVAKGKGFADRLLMGSGGPLRDASADGPRLVTDLVGFGPQPQPHQVMAYRRFTDDMPEQAYTHEAVFADLNQDGHPDAVTAVGQTDLGETSRVFMNLRADDGTWHWFRHAKDNLRGVTSRSVVYYGQSVADLDGDGDDDAVAVGRGTRILINDDGFLEDVVRRGLRARQTHVLRHDPNDTRPWVGPPDIIGEAARLGDIDGDGDADLVEVSWSPDETTYVDRIHLNVGGGVFRRAEDERLPRPGHAHNADNLLLFDADGDGDLDMLICNKYLDLTPQTRNDPRAVRNRLLLNDGGGFFEEATANLPAGSAADGTYAAAASDLDGDGDLDLVYANGLDEVRLPPPPHFRNMRERVLINQGGGQGGTEGVFRTLPGAFPLSVPDDNSEDLALADFDGDGDVDCAIANKSEGALPRIYFNRGDGRFEARANALPDVGTGWRHIEIEAGDLDLDGDADLVFFNQQGAQSSTYRPSRRLLYLRNDGTGRFTEWVHADHEPESYAGDGELIDVDGDGDLDIYVGAWDYKVSRILLNTTRGGFRKPRLEAIATPIVNRETPLRIRLRGRFLQPDVKVRLKRKRLFHNDPIIPGPVNWVSESEVWIGLPDGLEPGPWEVWLYNPDGKLTERLKLRVRRLARADVTLEPSVLGPGEKRWVTVTGSGFAAGTEAAFSGSGVDVIEWKRRDADHLELWVHVDPLATFGHRHLILTASGRPSTLLDALEIRGTRVSSITTVTGGRLRRGERAKITVRGRHLDAGIRVETTVPDGKLNVEAVRYVSPELLEIHADAAVDALPGSYDLILTRPDGNVAERGDAIEITSAPPRPEDLPADGPGLN